jgi:cytochrome b561
MRQWLGAQFIDWFLKGAPRVDARSVHIVSRVLFAVILLGHMGWRPTRGRRLPLADGPILSFIAKATHWTVYVLVTATVLVAWR